MVYFMQAVGGGPIKIGFARNIGVRHEQLESQYGRSLIVLAAMEGGRKEEKEIHARFAHLRIDRTEQFTVSPELVEFIGQIMVVNAVEVRPMVSEHTVISIKMTVQFRDWLQQVAEHEGISVVEFIEKAIIEYGIRCGLPDPPPRL
jgi:hypothetical protein